MLLKKQVIKSFKKLSEKFDAEDAIEILLVLNKIEKSKKEIKKGKGLSTSEARKELNNKRNY